MQSISPWLQYPRPGCTLLPATSRRASRLLTRLSLLQASLTELAPAASQAHHGPSLVSRMAAAAQELEQQGPLPPRSSFRQHLGRHTAFPPQGLAPVHEQPRSHTLAGDWPSSASYEAMGANGPSTAAGAAFHVDWSIPEELGPGPGGQQQSQEVAVGSTHLSQAAPFPHDPLGPSIWQAHAPSAAAASGGFTSAAFELPLLRQVLHPRGLPACRQMVWPSTPRHHQGSSTSALPDLLAGSRPLPRLQPVKYPVSDLCALQCAHCHTGWHTGHPGPAPCH